MPRCQRTFLLLGAGGLPPDGGALREGRAAGVDVDGMDHPPVLGEPGNAVGGIETAGEGEGDDTGSLHNA